MKKLVAGVMIAGLSVAAVGTTASAGKPDNPGCFGQARQAGVKLLGTGELPQYGDLPGNSEWGQEAARRGGNNASMNAAYKADNC